MSACNDAAHSRCDDSSTHSKASEEGKWIGITISLWIVILLVFWIVRTCTQPTRRQTFVHKLVCCFQKLCWIETATPTDGETSQGPVPTSQEGLQHTDSVISQHPPPSYKDAILLRAFNPRSSRLETHSNQLRDSNYEVDIDDESDEDRDDDDDEEEDDCFEDDNNVRDSVNATSTCGNGGHGRFRSRHSRCSLSSVSFTLATIEEDVNETRHSHSQPELHIPEVSASSIQENTRSKSVPSKLFTLTSLNTFSEPSSDHSVNITVENSLSFTSSNSNSIDEK